MPILDIKLKRSFLDFFQKRLYIDSKVIRYAQKEIHCDEVVALKYGVLQLYINGIKANRIYEITILGKANKQIQISFQSLRIFSTNKKMESTYSTIVQSLWDSVGKRLVSDLYDKLKRGIPLKIGDVEVNRKGILLSVRKWLFKKEKHFVEWKDLRKYSGDGYLYLFSESNKKVKTRLSYLKVWNVNMLESILDFLWQDGRAYQLAELENW